MKASFVAVASLAAATLFGSGPPEAPVRAQLVARNSAVLSSELGAKVERLHVREGAVFRTGELLLTFERSLQQAQVDRAQAVVASADRTYAANQRLHRLNSIGQVELDVSAAEVEKARAELAYARAMLAKTEIRAPFSGRVAEQRVREQEFVQPGQPLLDLIDDATPEVDFIAPSRWLGWIRVGQKLEIVIEETGRTYSAEVERISARVDPVSQSIKIVATISDPAKELIAGMSGTVSVAPP